MKLFVKIKPRARKTKIKKISETNFKIWVREPPEKGKANEALIEALSEYFKVAKTRFKIISGKASKVKILELI